MCKQKCCTFVVSNRRVYGVVNEIMHNATQEIHEAQSRE